MVDEQDVMALADKIERGHFDIMRMMDMDKVTIIAALRAIPQPQSTTINQFMLTNQLEIMSALHQLMQGFGTTRSNLSARILATKELIALQQSKDR